MRFLDEQFNFFELEKAGKLTQSIINVLRIVRMLGDFQQHGSILRRYYKQKELLQTDEFKQLLKGYQNHCQRGNTQKLRKTIIVKLPEKS